MVDKNTMMKNPLDDKVLALIIQNPGIRPGALNQLLGIEHSASIRNRLIKKGLIYKQRDGQAVRYYPKR